MGVGKRKGPSTSWDFPLREVKPYALYKKSWGWGIVITAFSNEHSVTEEWRHQCQIPQQRAECELPFLSYVRIAESSLSVSLMFFYYFLTLVLVSPPISLAHTLSLAHTRARVWWWRQTENTNMKIEKQINEDTEWREAGKAETQFFEEVSQ